MRFPLRRLLFCIVLSLSGFLFSTVVVSRAQDSQPSECSAENLDVRLLNQVESAAESDAHLLAVEIQNRDQATCQLGGLVVKFPPDDSAQRGDPWASDKSPAALAFKDKLQRLGSGETVHFLLGWSSSPLPAKGLVMDDCSTHDTVTLSRDFPGNTKLLLEVRHLWMKSCDQIWRSSYRLGPYMPGEPIAAEWLERLHLKQSDFPPLMLPEMQGATGAAHLAAAIRALADVEYLKGTFESGYSGYFELFLKLPSPAISNCPFQSLRKREADGQTVIYLNHCDDRVMQPSPLPNTKETRLLIREWGLLPERPGRLKYEVSSEVLQDGKPILALAQIELSIREPTQPMLPSLIRIRPAARRPN